MANEFVSLHTHSHNSILDGYSTTDEYLQRTADVGMRGIGLSDHGNTFGVYDFLKKAKAADIVGIPGCEFYVAPENPLGSFQKEAVFYNPTGKKVADDVSANGSYLHITVWAYNNTGLQNLFKLSTLSYNPERYRSKQRIDFEMLSEHSDGLIVATGCPSSEISTRFLLDQDAKAYEYAGRLLEVFGRDRLFVEIMDHDMSIDLERRLLPKQMELSKKLGIGLLATNDSHYAFPHDAQHHEEMLAKQSGSKMSEPTYDAGGTRFALSGEGYYLKSGEEMESIFPDRDFPGALSNSMKIMEMAGDIEMKFDSHLRPNPKVPEGMDLIEFYKQEVQKGFKKRYANATEEERKDAIARNKVEADVIISSGFAGYMLVVADYLRFARENFSTRDDEGEFLAYSTGVGRGSIGGSIHAYQLEISEIDPVRWGLIFERFLSAGRGHTYEVQYDDGTSEQLIASETKYTRDENGKPKKVFIHELEPGQEVYFGEK